MTPQFVLPQERSLTRQQIWRHLKHEAGEHLADRVEAAIRSQFSYLANFPAAGHHRPDLTADPVRFLSAFTFLILYRPERNHLKSLRFFTQSAM